MYSIYISSGLECLGQEDIFHLFFLNVFNNVLYFGLGCDGFSDLMCLFSSLFTVSGSADSSRYDLDFQLF